VGEATVCGEGGPLARSTAASWPHFKPSKTPAREIT
jgi:hypothetical protein